MTDVRHAAFTVEAMLDASPDRVFAAFAQPARRRRWLRMPGSDVRVEEDFRVGGFDTASSTFGTPEGEERLRNSAVYLEILPARRIVWAYTAVVNDVPRWSSLVTVELAPVGERTALSWTEQVAFLAASERPEDDLPHLRGAVRLRLNGLPAAVTS